MNYQIIVCSANFLTDNGNRWSASRVTFTHVLTYWQTTAKGSGRRPWLVYGPHGRFEWSYWGGK